MGFMSSFSSLLNLANRRAVISEQPLLKRQYTRSIRFKDYSLGIDSGIPLSELSESTISLLLYRRATTTISHFVVLLAV